MSGTKRPSTVAGLRRGVAAPPAAAAATSPAPQAQAAKPARVTLNLPPELYRQLQGWTNGAAEALGVPRVGVQETMRALIRVLVDDSPSPRDSAWGARVVEALHDELVR